MLANFEHREDSRKDHAWTGRYAHLHNLPHWHFECELIYIESGEVTVSLNHRAYLLKKNDAIFVDSGEVHYIKGSMDSVVTILMFDATIIQDITCRFCLESSILTQTYPIKTCTENVEKELSEKKPFYELKIRGMVLNLMTEIFRREPLAQRHTSRNNTVMENYKNLLNEIEEKYNYITFENACSFMGLSKPYFSRFFKNISGMTFSQYLNIIRLEKAVWLLNHNTKNLTITDISSQCGFDTIRHFNRVFKDFTGFSPRQLPGNYILPSHYIKSVKESFNPTLPSSRLLS